MVFSDKLALLSVSDKRQLLKFNLFYVYKIFNNAGLEMCSIEEIFEETIKMHINELYYKLTYLFNNKIHKIIY